jgi:predicted Zn-dependent peptidase
MRRSVLTLWMAVCLSACPWVGPGPAESAPPDYRSLSFGPISWPDPEVETFTPENGVAFFLIEDHELPLIQVRVMVRSGGFRVPESQTGLAEIAGEAMRSGGTREHPPQKLNELLADKAAEMETRFGFISGSAAMSVLKEDFEDLLPVFVELLHRPAFPEDKIEQAKDRLRTRIARRNDEQSGIAMRTFQRLLYGEDSLYAREPEYETVDNIRREDLVRFHRQAYGGANLLVGVAGDVDPGTIRSQLETAFSVFPKGEKTPMDLPDVAEPAGPSLCVVEKSDVNQGYLVMGHLGGRRQDPDYPVWQVMNKILGGGFTGRLFETIRTEMGLAYSVSGGYGAHYFYPGLFRVVLSTETANTAKAARAVKEVLKGLQAAVGPEELEQAKEQFFNSLVFRYDRPEDILSRRMVYAYRGMPPDSFRTLIRDIRQTTVGEVIRAARETLSPDSLITLAVGKQAPLVQQLEAFGEVEVLPKP